MEALRGSSQDWGLIMLASVQKNPTHIWKTSLSSESLQSKVRQTGGGKNEITQMSYCSRMNIMYLYTVKQLTLYLIIASEKFLR